MAIGATAANTIHECCPIFNSFHHIHTCKLQRDENNDILIILWNFDGQDTGKCPKGWNTKLLEQEPFLLKSKQRTQKYQLQLLQTQMIKK